MSVFRGPSSGRPMCVLNASRTKMIRPFHRSVQQIFVGPGGFATTKSLKATHVVSLPVPKEMAVFIVEAARQFQTS